MVGFPSYPLKYLRSWGKQKTKVPAFLKTLQDNVDCKDFQEKEFGDTYTAAELSEVKMQMVTRV